MEVCLSSTLERDPYRIACTMWGYRSSNWRQFATRYPNCQAVFPYNDEEWREAFWLRLASLTPSEHVVECLIEDMPANAAAEVARLVPSVELREEGGNQVLRFEAKHALREFIHGWRLPTLEAAWWCVPKSGRSVLTAGVERNLLYSLPKNFLGGTLTDVQLGLVENCHFLCVQNLDDFESGDPFFFSSHLSSEQLRSVLSSPDGELGELSSESLQAWLDREPGVGSLESL